MQNITAVNAFTDPVTVLEDGDAVAAGSSVPTAQALTNRTLYLKTELDAFIAQKNAASGLAPLTADRGLSITPDSGIAITALGVSGVGVLSTGSSGSAGVQGVGGAGAPGLVGTGTSGGAGVQATGSGAAAGVTATGGGTNGTGVSATGGGSNGNGISATGVGTGLGGIFQGGTGNGAGSFDDALRVNQNILLNGTNPLKNTGFTNRLTKKNACKAWALITLSSGIAMVVEGFNIASVALGGGNTYLTVTYAAGFNGANQSPILALANIAADPPTFAFIPVIGSTATNTTNRFYLMTSAAAVVSLASIDIGLMLHVFGEQ